uniref:Glucosamine 6-phosphate N-acetyltransferase n=1 Tax=Alona affinis TaxID=381656 RepID=A0A9N6WWN7_9CRUS|nr:EOG090X0FKI [Alona affinis]
MRSCSDTYYCTVVVDTVEDKIVGAATLLMERKFIRGLAKRARLENVVVRSKYRGKQLGKSVVEIVSNLGKALGAYKMTLDCKDAMIPFYQTLGYSREPGAGNMMSIRFPTAPAINSEAKL